MSDTGRFPILPPTPGHVPAAEAVALHVVTREAPDPPDTPDTHGDQGRARGQEASTASAPAPAAAVVSTSRELLARSRVVGRPALAEWGWRGALVRTSGGALRLGPGRAEREHRGGVDRLRRGFARPQTVVVANPKGGAGKTPTTLLLAATLGAYRGGYVVAWDDNETRGTLSVRADGWDGRATVWDLLAQVEAFESPAASVGDLGRFVRPQGARFDVLASDEDASRMAQIGRSEFGRLHAVLSRFYRVLVVDTGNNLRAANWQAAVAAADLLVVPTTYDLDSAYSAAWMLDHLCAAGREDLVASAVTVATPAVPRVDPAARGELLRYFARTAAVVEVPFDPALSGGGVIEHARLSRASRRAWVQVAAAVSDGLSIADTGRWGAVAP